MNFATDIPGEIEVWIVAGVATALILATVAWGWKHPIKWVAHTLIVNPLTGWYRNTAGELIDTKLTPVFSEIEKINAAIGPKNGTTIGAKVTSLQTTQQDILTKIEAQGLKTRSEAHAADNAAVVSRDDLAAVLATKS